MMSTTLLKQYISEVMMTQNIVRKDPEGSGNLIIRKLVTFEKPTSRFAPGDDVDTQISVDGTVKVDDLETWTPNFEKTKRRPRRRRSVRRLA